MWLGDEAKCNLPIGSHFVRVPLKVDGANNPNLRSGSLELFEVLLGLHQGPLQTHAHRVGKGQGGTHTVTSNCLVDTLGVVSSEGS